MLTKEQIKELMDKATKGPWYNGRLGLIVREGGKTVVSANILSDTDCAFIAALPDIAATALIALERVEELEKELEAIRTGDDGAIGKITPERMIYWYNKVKERSPREQKNGN